MLYLLSAANAGDTTDIAIALDNILTTRLRENLNLLFILLLLRFAGHSIGAIRFGGIRLRPLDFLAAPGHVGAFPCFLRAV